MLFLVNVAILLLLVIITVSANITAYESNNMNGSFISLDPATIDRESW